LRVRISVLAGLAMTGMLMPAGWGQAAQAADAAPASAKPGESMQGLRVEYPSLKPIPSPFPLGRGSERRTMLEFRAPEAMTSEDRAVADGAQVEIARRADLAGLHLSDAQGWGYEQAVCPAFPEHVILEYSRLNGPGDVTLFSAVVPRGSVGHVRVIPARRRGYSLWTPASSNALTLNDFNHMVKEGGLSPDWMMLSLCYTALASGHVRGALIPRSVEEEKYPLPEPAMMVVDSKKPGAQVRMVDTATPRPRGEWLFEFDGVGHLNKVKKVEPEILHTFAVQGILQPSETHGEPTAAP